VLALGLSQLNSLCVCVGEGGLWETNGTACLSAQHSMPACPSVPDLPQLLGLRWAALPEAEKKQCADLAAAVRAAHTTSGGTGGGR
jgi:hypothetical protein